MFRLRRPRSPVHALRRVLAVVLAAVAVVLALRPAAPAARARPSTVPVVVAARDLPPGIALTAAVLRTAEFPAGLVPRGSASVPARLVGRVLATAVRAGEPVTDVRIVGGGLTAQLPPGQVAAPVRLADLAITGLVRAGDRVDVLASLPDTARAEVVAGSALVLAATGAAGAAPGQADAGAGGLLLLAVDAPTAARLAAASASATLTVTLAPP